MYLVIDDTGIRPSSNDLTAVRHGGPRGLRPKFLRAWRKKKNHTGKIIRLVRARGAYVVCIRAFNGRLMVIIYTL